MTSVDRSAAEAAQSIALALEQSQLPYAIGGALALAVAGVPRGTRDVDINVFTGPEQLSAVLDVLIKLGMTVDRDAAHAEAAARGMFVARWDGMRVDVFLPSIPFSDEAARTRVRLVDSAGWSGWFLSAEALTVFKLLFFRGKDMVDLERLVAVRRELDKAYVRRWIVEMMGEQDERVRRWDDIVTRFAVS